MRPHHFVQFSVAFFLFLVIVFYLVIFHDDQGQGNVLIDLPDLTGVLLDRYLTYLFFLAILLLQANADKDDICICVLSFPIFSSTVIAARIHDLHVDVLEADVSDQFLHGKILKLLPILVRVVDEVSDQTCLAAFRLTNQDDLAVISFLLIGGLLDLALSFRHS